VTHNAALARRAGRQLAMRGGRIEDGAGEDA
jgi:predicted ABC-type transport system involved in lysophospholipase L1 biosynthesis ATPase subunit